MSYNRCVKMSHKKLNVWFLNARTLKPIQTVQTGGMAAETLRRSECNNFTQTSIWTISLGPTACLQLKLDLCSWVVPNRKTNCSSDMSDNISIHTSTNCSNSEYLHVHERSIADTYNIPLKFQYSTCLAVQVYCAWAELLNSRIHVQVWVL